MTFIHIGDITTEKSDCVSHVHKAHGTALRNLLKTNKEVKGSKGRLMSSHYRMQ